MADGDIELVESGDDGTPKYDVDSNMVIEHGEKREASFLETVKAATEKQKIDRDPNPWNRLRRQADERGLDHEAVVKDIEDYSKKRDWYEQVEWTEQRAGRDYVAEKLKRLQGVQEEQYRAQQEHAYAKHAADTFDRRHPDIGVGHPLRTAAQTIIHDSKGQHDKRLFAKGESFNTVAPIEIYERALSLALQDAMQSHPQARARQGVIDQMEARDAARRAGKATI